MTPADIAQYIWPLTVLVIFTGMLTIAWRALSIAHDLAELVLKQGLPQAKAVPSQEQLPTPTPAPAPAPPAPTVPEPPHPLVNNALLDFVAKQEGFSAKAYWDYKQWTIGYGTKASSSTEVITEAEAKKRLLAELNIAAKAVEEFIPNAPLGVKQAMVDATYNLGTGWEKQSLGAALKAGKYDTAAADLLQYNHAGGKELPALTRRREAEVSWFNNPL